VISDPAVLAWMVYFGGGAAVALVLTLLGRDGDDLFIPVTLWPAFLFFAVVCAPAWLAAKLGRWVRRRMEWGS
jgi:hypothetical protein